MEKSKVIFHFKPFSKKQRKVLNWWTDNSPVNDADGIIADGAIRSGKTVSMSLSYVMWAMERFDNQNFAMCGKTVGSFRRNVWFWLKIMLLSRGYKYKDHKTENYIEISRGSKMNYFYIFGGRDESSQDLIQGITLSGIFFDEVALMPESFVNQGTGRCSVEGSKYFFNCNPDGPMHWFNQNWILKAKEKNLIYLHFTMDDNLSLSEKIKARYRSMYVGVFAKRYILGLWAVASGAIFDMWSEDNEIEVKDIPLALKNTSRRYIGIDYGTTNPTVFLDIYDDGELILITREYYYDSKISMKQKTDKEYADDLVGFIKEGPTPTAIVLDPSAASFKAELKGRGIRVKEADNEVLDGIRITSTLIGLNKIKMVKEKCKRSRGDILSYVWDEKASLRGEEKPLKENDHACITGDTVVDTISGSIPIKDLVGKTGLLYCFDLDRRGKTISGYYNVCKTKINVDVFRIELEDGRIIKATLDHPILTKRGWIKVRDLNDSDYIFSINNYQYKKIRDINYRGKEDVYNMQVEKHKNFSINGGLIIHNCDALRYFCKTIVKPRRLSRF